MQTIYSPVYSRLRYKACDNIAILLKLIKYSVPLVDKSFASLHLFVLGIKPSNSP